MLLEKIDFSICGTICKTPFNYIMACYEIEGEIFGYYCFRDRMDSGLEQVECLEDYKPNEYDVNDPSKYIGFTSINREHVNVFNEIPPEISLIVDQKSKLMYLADQEEQDFIEAELDEFIIEQEAGFIIIKPKMLLPVLMLADRGYEIESCIQHWTNPENSKIEPPTICFKDCLMDNQFFRYYFNHRCKNWEVVCREGIFSGLMIKGLTTTRSPETWYNELVELAFILSVKPPYTDKSRIWAVEIQKKYGDRITLLEKAYSYSIARKKALNRLCVTEEEAKDYNILVYDNNSLLSTLKDDVKRNGN